MRNRFYGAPLSALLLAAVTTAAAAPVCPGGAAWCDDFEHGLGRWEGAAADYLQAQPGTGNHLLRLRAGVAALLVRPSEAAGQLGQSHFVEARLRAAPGVTGQAYVIARYADASNWLGFGLDASRGDGRIHIVLASMRDGRLEILKQGSADGKPADSFVTARLDVDGNVLTMYLDGLRIVGTSVPATAPDRLGLVAVGGDFDVDDLRVGDAQVPPAHIGLSEHGQHLELQAGDGQQRYPVRTIRGKRIGAPPIVAVSSNPVVAGASVDGSTLILTPNRPGKTTISIIDGDDNNLAVTLDTVVGPRFAASSQTYPLHDRALPNAGATDVPPDTALKIRFDSTPQPGASGSVRIYRSSDDRLVDVIRLGDEVDTIAASPDGWRRVVRYHPIQVDGKLMTIRPHDGRLAYDTDYYVQADASLATGASLGGKPFTGISKAAGWRFHTRAHMPTGHSFTVADEGPANFRTIQGALDHAMRNLSRKEPVTIHISNGRYVELLYLRGKDNVTLRGESRAGVVITAENNDSLNPGAGTGQPASSPGASGGRAVFLIQDADLVHLDHLTMVNTAWNASPPGGQSETIDFASDGRFVATDASFISEQDTIRVEGYSWFYHSLIAGTVDFIWGYNHAALFEEDEIRSVGNSNGRVRGGYVVQARTIDRDDPGFVFLNSHLTHGTGGLGNDTPVGSNYLARPGTAATWDKVSYINCRIDEHIARTGWTGQPRDGAGWYEYGSVDIAGKPLDLSRREGGAVLPVDQARRFSSRSQVFAGFDQGRGWNPSPADGL